MFGYPIHLSQNKIVHLGGDITSGSSSLILGGLATTKPAENTVSEGRLTIRPYALISGISAQNVRAPTAGLPSQFQEAGASDVAGNHTGTQAHSAWEYEPKTELGRKLRDIRQRAIADGLQLLSPDEIAAEVQDRRYGRDA